MNNCIVINGRAIELTVEQVREIRKSLRTEGRLCDVKVGKTFTVAGIEFIKFSQNGDTTVAVAKDCLIDQRFGDDNNFSESDILKYLQEDLLPKLEAEVGADKVLEFETDLLSLDGSDEYGKITTKISIPTFDFYRQNAELFRDHNPGVRWWLATPDSTPKHSGEDFAVSVNSSGSLSYGESCYYDHYGVRPFLVFESSISVSYEVKQWQIIVKTQEGENV